MQAYEIGIRVLEKLSVEPALLGGVVLHRFYRFFELLLGCCEDFLQLMDPVGGGLSAQGVTQKTMNGLIALLGTQLKLFRHQYLLHMVFNISLILIRIT